MGAIRTTEQFDGRIHLRIKCPLDFRYVELAVPNADGCRTCHVTRERGGGYRFAERDARGWCKHRAPRQEVGGDSAAFPETLAYHAYLYQATPASRRWMKRYSKTDCMEPIANCMHAIPIPYRFQYEKCEKKSWELQAYTYTAFVAPLQLSRWSFTSRPRLTLGEIKNN